MLMTIDLATTAPGTKRTFYSDLLNPRPCSICNKTFENSGKFPFGITKAMVLEPATFLRSVTEAMPSESIVTSTLLACEVRFVPEDGYAKQNSFS